MLAGSYLNTYRGKESELYYQPGKTRNGIEYRNYSTQQTRIGAHANLDYDFNRNHKLTWYNGYMDMDEAEVRDGSDESRPCHPDEMGSSIHIQLYVEGRTSLFE